MVTHGVNWAICDKLGKFMIPEINECDSSPCQNGATCNEMVEQYNCTCAAGFIGNHCQNGKTLV